MKKLAKIISLIVLTLSCFITGGIITAYAQEQTLPPVSQDIKAVVLEQGHILDANVEKLNFDDLYLSTATDFDQNNASKSMFGGFIEMDKARIEKSFEISVDLTVLESADSASNFGLGIRNVSKGKNEKVNLIQSGGYEILIGKNARLDGVASTSISTLSIVKNGELLKDNSTGAWQSAVDKYAVFELPSWLTLEKGKEYNLKIGSQKIVAQDKPLDTIGYYLYVTATDGQNSKKVAEVYDYCDNGVNIGSVMTGIVSGKGAYSLTTKNSDNVTTTEDAKVYDILQLDQGVTSYYNKVAKGLFGRARTATAESLEVNMRIVVDTSVKSWHMFDVGLKNCYNGEYDHFHGGYDFKIGQNNKVDGGNSKDTVSIVRNGLYDGKDYHVNAVKVAKLPDDFSKDMFTKGASFKLTVGLKKIVSGDTAYGYYAYLKYNDRLIIDFYDYFDYQANLDYFGDVFTGGIEAEGAYYITTCGNVDKEFEQFEVYDLSSLVPVTSDGINYSADSKSATSEKVVSRFITGKESLGVKYKVKFTGAPLLDLSLRGLDDSSKADSIRYAIDVKNQTFRVYSIATKAPDFDSGELDLSEVGIEIEKDKEYLVEYGFVRYKYLDVADYNRAQVYLKIDGITAYRYDMDYIGKLVLGSYVGGRIIGESSDGVTIIPTEQNQLTVTITADKLKDSFVVGERNAIVYQSTVPTGLAQVEYKVLSGEENVSINPYGAVTAIKSGTSVIKVIVTNAYGVFESNEVTLQIGEAEVFDDGLAKEIVDLTVLWIALGIALVLAGGAVVTIIILKKKK